MQSTDQGSELENTARLYGANILFWRNNSKLTPQMAAQHSNIPIERYLLLEGGKAVPSAQEISALSDALVISQRDLLPLIPDTDRGIKPQTWDDILKSIRTITRNGVPHYEYADLVLTREVPQMRPEYLKILITEGEKVVINNGHVLHQLTFLLHGQLEFYWQWPTSSSGKVHKRIFNERDSWFIRAYVPHAFRSTNPDDLAEIIAFTFSSTLTNDAIKELQMLGPLAGQRIGSGDKQWYTENKSSGSSQ